jgi:dienelactone hydrolase
MPNETHRPRSAAFAAALLSSLFALAVLTAFAKDDGDGFYPPDQLGPYSIGHTTLVVFDTSRNPDGSTPVTGPGRPLYVHMWYPTTAKIRGSVAYTWNDPVYNQNPGGAVYPGLPDLPALTFKGSPSLHDVGEAAPLARGSFPLLIATHGNLVAAAKNMPDTLETLASHGYIIASVEHTGNDDASYQASFLEADLRLPLGPNPSLGANTILERSKDVSFIIDSVQNGLIDRKAAIAFLKSADLQHIGVLGYSLGGETTLATVTGIGAANYPADRRVKAAFMGAGTNYGLLLSAADYANARVPLMFFGNDSGIAYDNFNEFDHSEPKYLIDVGGINHHVGGYQSSWCADFHNSMAVVNPAAYPGIFINSSAFSSSDIVNYVYDATFYFSYTGARETGVYDYCEPAAFNGISDAQLESVVFGDSSILTAKSELQPLMPLKPEVSIAETTRLTNWYAVAFFNKTLKHQDAYDFYLTNSEINQRTNPLVDFVKNCERVEDHPIDLQPSDKITFVPAGREGYEVSVTSGAALYDQGTTALKVASTGTVVLSYPGFSFPAPGFSDAISTLIVNEDGVITTRTSADYPTIDDNGSPWYTRGQLLLSNQFMIGALMKSLLPSSVAGSGVYGYYDTANHRVIITYSNMAAAGTTSLNTLQVALYSSGKIEMIIGQLGGSGAISSPNILGTIGIASGRTPARDLKRVRPIDFGRLRGFGPVYLPFGEAAIYQQFYNGTGATCADRT